MMTRVYRDVAEMVDCRYARISDWTLMNLRTKRHWNHPRKTDSSEVTRELVRNPIRTNETAQKLKRHLVVYSDGAGTVLVDTTQSH
jgi:hypothetical protein